MQPVLQFENVSIQIHNDQNILTAVNNISFELKQASCTALIGESGSGKTLTSLSILQLLPEKIRSNGNIIFYKDNDKLLLHQLSNNAMNSIRGKSIGMIFQEPSIALNPLLSCGYQISEVIIHHLKLNKKQAKQKTIQLLQEVELPNPAELYKRRPHEISGGQKQRVMIAMAIACRPSLLIADEPTTALDVMTQQSIMKLLMKLKNQYNLSILLVTHDIGLAADYADEVIVLYRGEIVAQGKTNDILYYPQHDYTKALLNCRSQLIIKEKKIPAFSDLKEMTPSVEVDNETRWHAPHNISPVISLLRVENISVKFCTQKNFWGKPTSYQTALNNINFDIYKNEIVGIVGESGCGKTTLGKTILQIIQPSSGNILFNGQPLRPQTTHKNKNTNFQIIFQDPYSSLNPRITVGQAIEEPIKVHRPDLHHQTAKQKAVALLHQVGLDEKMYHRYPHEFSGGQRQRIAIARALAVEPTFIVFDESIAALDLSIQAQMLHLIMELKNTFGLTALFISHDLIASHYICDRILVMKDGHIVESGSADNVLLHPQSDYTKSLIDATPGKSIFQRSF